MTDPNFQGIDPQQLGQLMQSLRKGVNNAQPLVNSYMGQFGRLGLDTTAVTRLQQNYSWSQSQQGMLQRRYDLASHQPSGQWVNGMATSGAGALRYTTRQQAQTAGANAGKQFRDGKISASQATYVYQKEVANAGAWKNSVTSNIGTAVGDTISIVTDPGKWAGTIATSAANFVATNLLTNFVNGLPSGGSPTPPSLSTWQSTHETDAVDAFDSASANPQLQTRDPLDRALVESASNYGHGSFVIAGKNGKPATIMNPKNMSRQQLQAYNAWLNDPAVVAKTMNVGPDVAWGQGYWDYTGQENMTPQ